MTTIKRTSSATWSGGIESGSGLIRIGRSDTVLPFTLKTRIGADPATNPEELLGSALAGCYSMSLSGELDSHGTPAEQITSTATVHLVGGDNGFSIPTVDLDVVVRVSGLDDAEFQRIAQVAHDGCPVSRLFDADVRLTASLEGQA